MLQILGAIQRNTDKTVGTWRRGTGVHICSMTMMGTPATVQGPAGDTRMNDIIFVYEGIRVIEKQNQHPTNPVQGSV